MSRPRVAVIRGGPSDEFEVSLRTGASVIASINRDEFDPLDIVISQAGEWIYNGRIRYPEDLMPVVDVVFIALHGKYGEDGTIQRLLERFGVPYTGSGPYASKIAMHKVLTKEHIKGLDILLPQHHVIRTDDGITPHRHAAIIKERFGPRYILKPIDSGSSIGVEIVFDPFDLANAISRSLTHAHEILVEEYIAGRETTCGVIERFRNQNLYALPTIEIVPPEHAVFFNKDVKYDGSTHEICPSRFNKVEKREIEEAAKAVHGVLGLDQYSRSDFILSPHGLYFLEVNTLPGLTRNSLFPKALEAVGSSHSEFVSHLINDALKTN